MGQDTQYATVKVWSGDALAHYEDILGEEPDEYRMEVVTEDTHYVPHEDHAVLAESIDHHGTYAFDVECDAPVELHVETSDHYHDTVDGFERGASIERGLLYRPDSDAEPFKTEIWGAIRMRVEESDR